MSEPLTHFRTVCREAFAFLTSDYRFREITNPLDSRNPYIVEFGNNAIVLRVLGEGYGTVARVEYIGPDGRPVESAILEPDWEPNPRRMRRKKHRGPKLSQDDQIRAAAEQTCLRDQDILRGNYIKLLEGASRQERVLSRYAMSNNWFERSRGGRLSHGGDNEPEGALDESP